jgi:hypothetical protein
LKADRKAKPDWLKNQPGFFNGEPLPIGGSFVESSAVTD